MTTYKELYDRQAELQRISLELGHAEYTDDDLDLAILDEVGEVTHELKGKWCWWKPEAAIDDERLLSELADVLHFTLIRDLNRWRESGGPLWRHDGREVGWPGPEGRPRAWQRTWLMIARELISDKYYDSDDFLFNAALLLGALGIEPQRLLNAYFAKTDENIRRWESAKGARP